PVADNKSGYYMSVAPLVVGRKVLVGASGGELGIRGFVAAYDVDSGKEAWRTYTVPAPGEAGSETWPKGDQWKTGGGPVWVTGNYDPETNLAFWGTGNGGPWTGRHDIDPARQPGTGKEAEFCPSHWGGKNWPPIAFSPRTRMIYIPANENLCSSVLGRAVTYTAGGVFIGATNTFSIVPGA